MQNEIFDVLSLFWNRTIPKDAQGFSKLFIVTF